MFIVILRYIVDISVIDQHRPAHLVFLDEQFQKGIFVASGMQAPRYGGVIIAKSPDRQSLLAILKNDPYYLNNCAEYQVTEFIPNKYSPEFEKVINA